MAKKIVLRKRAGLNIGERGHAVTYEVVFPEFPESSPFLRDVNRLVRTSHEEDTSEFAKADWPLVWEGIREPEHSIRLWYGCGGTKVIHVSDHAVCLLDSHWEYTGGAHGNGGNRTRCFIEDNGHAREVKLADLFEPSSDWAKRLLTFVTEDLRRQGASSLTGVTDPEAGDSRKLILLEIDDLQTFALAPSGLWIFFAPYHVGCYAEGSYSVKVPYSKIEDCIPVNSPARLFMPAEAR